jgi:hypothetical protein
MLHAVSNDTNDSWHDDNAAEIYTGAEFDGIGEEDNDGLDSAAKGYHQTQVLINSLPEGHMEAEFVSLHLPSHLEHAWYNKKKTWQWQNCAYRRVSSMTLCITSALPWATNPIFSEVMCIQPVCKD